MTNERPKSEPEIIPPGRGTQRVRVFIDPRITERVYVAKPGPFGSVLLILIVGLLSALMLVLLLGAFLFALPLVILVVTAAVVAGMLRVYFKR